MNVFLRVELLFATLQVCGVGDRVAVEQRRGEVGSETRGGNDKCISVELNSVHRSSSSRVGREKTRGATNLRGEW